MSDGVPPDDWLETANLHATVAQLLSTVVHQVNNALQTIGGHAELLKTDPGATETTRRRAAAITASTDRTAEMLARLQVLTRPASDPSVQNLRDVAETALAFRQYGLGRARIETSIQGDEHAHVLAEARALMQAVLNVILNAEQALSGAAGGGRIVITIVREAASVRLTVDDNGPGLPPPLAFEPRDAWQIGVSNRLGLGLRSASAIVTRLGGSLVIEAPAGGGSRVSIRLPAASSA